MPNGTIFDNTSKSALMAAIPAMASRREKILSILADRPATLWEVAAMLGCYDHQVSGRFTELAADDLIERTGERRKNPTTHCQADVWQLAQRIEGSDMTNLQIKTLRTAVSQLKLIEEQYRMLLANVASVDSCKRLNNESYEDVMAVLEDMGFHQTGQRENYWRSRVATRDAAAGPRMVWKIHALAKSAKIGVAGFCNRMSKGRTFRPEELSPREAYNVVEAMKTIERRNAEEDANRLFPVTG